jgi:hypothetical protein
VNLADPVRREDLETADVEPAQDDERITRLDPDQGRRDEVVVDVRRSGRQRPAEAAAVRLLSTEDW